MFFLLLSLLNMLSFFRKLSIGGKIKDGILPEAVMGTAEDLLTTKNQMLKTDTELKESVYGKFCILLVCCIARPYGYLPMSREMECDIANDLFLSIIETRVMTEIFQVQVLSIYHLKKSFIIFQIY